MTPTQRSQLIDLLEELLLTLKVEETRQSLPGQVPQKLSAVYALEESNG